MFGKIYPQSAAHITTIHGYFTILQFTDPRSLVLDRRSPFPISDSRSCLSSKATVYSFAQLGCEHLRHGRRAKKQMLVTQATERAAGGR